MDLQQAGPSDRNDEDGYHYWGVYIDADNSPDNTQIKEPRKWL